MRAINPSTAELLKEYPTISDKEAAAVIAQSHDAFMQWHVQGFTARGRHLVKVADLLEQHKEKYACLITQEMGKTIRESRAEIEKCALTCRYYAKHAATFLADEPAKTAAKKSYTTFKPLGVILAVMPWNFPFWQVFRFAAPALMAGNAVVLKHASNVPGCAMAIEALFRTAGMPLHVFRTLLIDSSQVDAVIKHPHVAAVTLTGSTKAGKAVARRAGESLKKTVLELGGSDAYIILDDADIVKAAKTCMQGRLINAGQSCIAAKRFIVVSAIYEAFLAVFTDEMKKAKMGDPLKEDTQFGPLCNAEARDNLHKQVKRSVRQGARCVLGGKIPSGVGAYYPATILTDIKPGMPAWDEELFGPVASVIRVKNEEEAIAVANATQFGLGGGVFTRDLARGERLARDRLESGSAFVNAFVKSDPNLPFGGIKQSGYGRELSAFGIREFVNIKSVAVFEAN